ncbi:ribosomal protein S18-alanine N-acetyltransferase [Haloarchaeobius amylolyticus]|uniref:ribosomal protein S18-alanine N-acetyltransferase n=1 Tax=Haloarchaeobius amylolyticus TaxID=1198296 RepID=UPI0022708F8F
MTTTAPNPSNDVTIRPAEQADLLAVYRIEKSSFPQPWPFDAFQRFLDAPGFLVATEGQKVTGYVVADCIPNHGRGIGHVKDIAVHPKRRGQGIGRRLLARAIATLASQNATSVKLEVRETNDVAKDLYRDFGFEPLRRIPRYYDDGEAALVMVKEL